MKRKKQGPDPIDIQVGARIRTLRIQNGRSQEWLADKLGLTFQQIQKYEKGTNRIAPSRLEKVSEVLNAPIEYFFGKQKGSRTDDFEGPGQIMLATNEGNYVARRWTELSANQRKFVRLVVAVLSKDTKTTKLSLD